MGVACNLRVWHVIWEVCIKNTGSTFVGEHDVIM